MTTTITEYKPPPGTSLMEACRELARLAPARMDFNGIIVESQPGDSPDALCARWHTQRLELSTANEAARLAKQRRDAELEAAVKELIELVPFAFGFGWQSAEMNVDKTSGEVYGKSSVKKKLAAICARLGEGEAPA